MKNWIDDAVAEGEQLCKGLSGQGVLRYARIGSSLIPGVRKPKDVDFLLLVNDLTATRDRLFKDVDATLCAAYDGVDGSANDWLSMRVGHVNLIITASDAWYERCRQASEVCVLLNLARRIDRIRVYRVVRDGLNAEDALRVFLDE